jgi:hypothetical protein
VVAPDPFVVISAGRSLFRVKELLALASLLREFSGSAAKGGGVKEILPICKDNCADFGKKG